MKIPPKLFIALLLSLSFSLPVLAQVDKVLVHKDKDGFSLKVGGEKFIINGMNWDYFPIGTTYTYSLWTQSDEVIREALDKEMALLKNMGVNTIRVYTGIPPRWIEYIHTRYGIYTMLNHSFGRYGLNVGGVWKPNTEYSDPQVRELLIKEVEEMAQTYKGTPGLLMFLLGNENNYGLFWDGAETEDIPMEDRKSTLRARPMYKLFNDATLKIKGIDDKHPVAICNGDLLFLDIIAEECKDIDILGINAYRGISFTNLFERVSKEYGKPLMFTEFGADAYNTITHEEDQYSQAWYLLGNWKEIYANAAGMGGYGNSLGGFTFQFSDGWWKHGQTTDLDIQDSHASWSNGGYLNDYREGENNMNEEWFGICAKGPSNAQGIYSLYPRTAYYALQEAHRFNPYASGVGQDALNRHFQGIELVNAGLIARGDKAALET